ncbi:uncharacterized protein UMAG_05426 [Mycosarcoma maydis]|uniref:Uncharacterized protein n=1 Tax=Mycosarcoma maydis TaxID=5270 RepID=A0A0D1CHJ2_MYCMD|nr:uncharacterized protein UMAG_05426 [Ustilago maydis 521]KIS66433.1 hypothetical protein UMAG_05426 [Ustilago maydis 521]|eukprot:XP_011392113.1 hypothetical protein UMAG_05426 [Ustilago maydis 521]
MRDFSGAGHHPPQSANTPLPSTRNDQDEPNRQDDSGTVLERFQALESTIRNLSDEMRSYYQSIAQSLHWLDNVIPHIYPAAARAASATNPPLVPLDTSSHRGVRRRWSQTRLQKPFRDELRHRIVNGLAATEPSPAL